jgi:predicted Zn-dependent protease
MWFPGLNSWIARRVNRLRARGRRSKAERLAWRLARLRPGQHDSWTLLGEVLIAHSQYTEAEAALRLGRERHPVNPEINYLLAKSLIGQSRTQEAADILLQQHAATPDSFFPSLGLVYVHRDESDEKALATAVETAQRIPPDYPWGKFELAVMLLHIEGGRSLARELLEAAARSLPPTTPATGSHTFCSASC